jgi:signal transduction histidine kinase
MIDRQGRVKATVESSDIKAGQGIGPLLRELRGVLIEPPKAERPKSPARTGVSVERTAQVAGLQAILMPLIAAPLLLLAGPTVPLGDAGWALALVGNVIVIVIGVRFVRSPAVSVQALAASNAFTAGVLAILAWLSGGFGSPFPILFPLLASSITPHRPRVRRILLAWLLLCIALPVFYENSVSGDDVAELIMIGAASVATLLTMVWLSSRVSRSEVGLMDAISTARVAQKELAAEAERLFELNEERDRLVTRVSHELRTPLTSVKGYVEALMEGEGGDLDPAQRELAAVALRNTVRLELLIADLLLLSRVEAGQLELRPAPVEIGSLLDLLSKDLEQLTREQGVRLIVEAPSGVVWNLDRERFEQAVTNLLSNAIKYSPGGGPVLVRSRPVGSELWVEVIDKGVGIPEDEIARLGDRFFRASTAGNASGSGLGIAITQELVDLHRGALEVESEVGSGSVFRIRIPGDLAAGSPVEAERDPD